MTSVERVKHYQYLEQENTVDDATSSPPNWPTSGSIVFNDLALLYKKRNHYALKRMSFKIENKEKVYVLL